MPKDQKTSTSQRLFMLEEDVRVLKAKQPVENALATPFVGESVALNSISIKEQTLSNIMISLASSDLSSLLSGGKLETIAKNISSAFDSLNTNSQVIEMTVGVNITPKFVVSVDSKPSSPAIEPLQDLEEVIQVAIGKHLRHYGYDGK